MNAGSDSISPWWPAVACLIALGTLSTACDGGPTGGAPTCGQETAVAIGVPVQGRLRDGDARFDGAFVDYYSLSLGEPVRLTVRLSSREMDPLLLLFDAGGSVVAQAFNAEGTPAGIEETAALTRSFGAGCHLLAASAWSPDTTGAYRLTVRPAE